MWRYGQYCIPMAVYGAARSWRAQPLESNLTSVRVGAALANGLYYASPLGFLKLVHTADRVEILMTKKKHTDHAWCYEEIGGSNPHVLC